MLQRHKGLWNAEAEKMILKHFNVEIFHFIYGGFSHDWQKTGISTFRKII